MATTSVPYSFTNATNADATKVNADFTALINFINTEVIHRDGSIAFTALPTLAADPTVSTQAARKGYVDSAVLAGVLSGDVTGTVGATTIAAGVIVNADVNASAAIGFAKLAGVLNNGGTTNPLVTISASAPSGGAAGDIWFKY
jgi:hypothetical protein